VNELPKGWILAKFSNILFSLSSGLNGKQNKTGDGIPVSRIETIANQSIDMARIGFIKDYDEEKTEKYRLHEGDILFSNINSPSHLGKTALCEKGIELYHGVNLLKITVNKAISPSILNYYCKYIRGLGEFSAKAQHAVNQSSLNQTKLKEFDIPLPPLNEQKRIADKLDSILAKVDKAQARLEKIPTILKRFRQSVLTAATSGELTKEWREKKQEEYYFKEYIFDELLVELRNGLSPKPNQESKGSAILRISSVRSGVVDQSDIRHLECDEKIIETYKLYVGDLLFTRYNGSIDYVGVCGLIRELKHNVLVYPDKLIRARLNSTATPEYIEIYFYSDQARNNLTGCIKSTSGQKGISGKDIKAQKVMVPSIAEQKEIVNRVEALFAKADKVEKQYKETKARIGRLTQSILAKAFRGELVPQDENDEPAEKLLTRIKANSVKTKAKPATKKKTKAA
jgi:type I restriction enzyme S subunit